MTDSPIFRTAAPLPLPRCSQVPVLRLYAMAQSLEPVLRQQLPAIYFSQTQAGRALVANFKGNQQ